MKNRSPAVLAAVILLWPGRLVARDIESLDGGWRFHRGDLPGWQDVDAPRLPTSPAMDPWRARFDDSTWEPVQVPHDYVVDGSFDPGADPLHGSLPLEPGWYRRRIDFPADAAGKRWWIEFDGVYRDSRTWFNGHFLGRHASGYTSFRFDVTEFVRPGQINLLAVRVDPTKPEGWWYDGGGIYRHVRLVSVDPVHVAPWGVFIRSDVDPDPDGVGGRAQVRVTTTLANSSGSVGAGRLQSEIVDPQGRRMAATVSSVAVGTNGLELEQTLRLARCRLWSIDRPNLYELRTSLFAGDRLADRVTTRFGLRTIQFDAPSGFRLNGRPVRIQGTCNHQDFAGVGVALPDRIQVARVEKLKEMGANAYRCAHHPPSPVLLDACDRLGMLVMDENRHLGDSPEILAEVESMVRRDRNHPSVVLWSLCNEEEEQGTAVGARQGRAMKELIRRLDPDRPVTAAMNGGFGTGLATVVDVLGMNYHVADYDRVHRELPNLPMISTESAAAFGTRGIYAKDERRGYLSAYDTNAPDWGNRAGPAWTALAGRPWMAGGFVWSGFDYRGEPTPYGWPCVNSHFGILDLCGFPKDVFWYYQSWWSDEPVLHLFPHWNWPGREGEDIAVWCYTNCERVELFQQGRSLGARETPPNGHLEWKVKFIPGRLVAKGVRRGRKTSTRLETAGNAAAVRLVPDRTALQADGEDLSLITVEIIDRAGRVVPTADHRVSFDVSGPGRILGVGNGQCSSHERDHASYRRAFNGRCLVIVQSTGARGRILVKAESPGLARAAATLRATR